ncbi:hypothetical protein [Pyxidicoccus xibeiensis]|uniref:hypothetical protein n=1 Tax=Pyxidicoccus xibeiensis TaxID=2906759 RepID=UPI0020A74E16|nr:hypothetical protein [Pyxidicoccus xibeiensis]MCP3138110.1 hypothetical protein [Pyxidicoccus xibeiensis]
MEKVRALVSRLLPLALLASLAGCAGSARPASTYRVLRTECERCDLEALTRALSGPEARDCGRAMDPSDAGARARLDLSACVQEAQLQGRPFHATYALAGADAGLKATLARGPDGTLTLLWYDPDADGRGPTCGARIWRTPCARIRPDAQDGTLLACEPQGPREDACSEPATRRQEQEGPLDAAFLACEPTRNRDVSCEERVTGGDAIRYKHCGPTRVPAWRCTATPERRATFAPGSDLSCTPEPGAALLCKGGQSVTPEPEPPTHRSATPQP